MDVNQRIEKQLAEYPVLLYMKGTPDFPQCGFSARVVAALRQLDAKFAFVNIFEDPEIREGLKAYSNWPTFPQLYVDGELIGGCDIAVEMYESGELAEVLASAGQSAGDTASEPS
ncbi:MAG TPA: Grx4 family monothiol glutaredoxin [Gammaproteobacteria bacterium]